MSSDETVKVPRTRPPEDADPDSPAAECGWSYDHDAVVTYEGEDGVGWMCRRCGGEGWEPADETEEADR